MVYWSLGIVAMHEPKVVSLLRLRLKLTIKTKSCDTVYQSTWNL